MGWDGLFLFARKGFFSQKKPAVFLLPSLHPDLPGVWEEKQEKRIINVIIIIITEETL